MKINQVKRALAAGQVQLGTHAAYLQSPDVARILGAAGFHWAFLDGEHGPFDVSMTRDLCRAAVSANLSPVVRVADLQYSLVARALDGGAEGIMFPRVESPELLATAVKWTKFPPLGVRGYGLTPHWVDYEKVSIAQIIEHVNANTMVVLQIETQRAVDACDELLAVGGIDVVMVGPADLSISLGVPGDFLNPKMVAAMEKVRDICIARNVTPGTQTRNLDLAKFWRERGMRFLGCSSDTGMLYERAVEIVRALG
ncbi:MAG TPA: aldolase/citrate lyase family protein [Bryobacteraceae bacterium]|nr:aldolase/citrate lyase family protein [Bryobacteraceae bacterium]